MNFPIQELENKTIELSKKYWQTQNPDVRVQIQTFLNMYREELKVRRAQEKSKKTDNDDNSDNLINIQLIYTNANENR